LSLLAIIPHVGLARVEKAEATAQFSLRQVFDLQWASDPQVAPEGARVAFVHDSFDIMKDSVRQTIWLINTDGTDLHPLTDPDLDASSPRWSPSGDRLLYVTRDKEKRADIRVIYVDKGTTARLVSLAHPPRELTWSPDGRSIAFAMFVPAPQKPLVELPAPPKGADWGPPIRLIDRLIYRFNGRGYLPHGWTHLFVVPAQGGTPHQVTSGEVDDGGSLAWTSDGKSLIFSANRHPDAEYQPLNSEIYEVPAGGGEIKALTDRDGPDHQAVVSPDGSLIAYTGFDDHHQGYQVSHLYIMNRDASGRRIVDPAFDRSIERPRWSPDGKGVYFAYDDQGVTKIGYLTLSGQLRELASNAGGLDLGRPYAEWDYGVAAKAGVFAFTLTAPDHPADIAVGMLDRPGIKRLTDLNQGLFGHEALGTVEPIHFASSYDQRNIEGWIMKPADFDPGKKYPLILEIHGGPYLNYGPRFAAEDQLFAAAGYVVLYINPRGSTSYGEQFGNLIHLDYPDHDYDDLMSGVDAILEKGYIDPQRLFVTGGSGGGVLTAWIVGHTDRFRAAVVAKPVINWYSWVLTSDLPSFGLKYWFSGYPWAHLDNYMKHSPISYAGNVKTPTLVITGGEDYRTPSAEAEQFYEALKLRKVPSAMVQIPDANHEISAKPSNMMAKVGYILGWFARYGGDPPTAE